mgnify:CR=1 FL=1
MWTMWTMWTTFTIPASFALRLILYSIHNVSTHICIFCSTHEKKAHGFLSRTSSHFAKHWSTTTLIINNNNTSSKTTIHRLIENSKAFSGIKSHQLATQHTLLSDAKYQSTNDNVGRAFCGVQWNCLQNTRRLHANQPSVLCWDIIPCLSSNEPQRSPRRRGHSS